MYTVLGTHVGLLISGAGKHALEKTMKKLILPTNIIFLVYNFNYQNYHIHNCHVINFTWNIVQIQKYIAINSINIAIS